MLGEGRAGGGELRRCLQPPPAGGAGHVAPNTWLFSAVLSAHVEVPGCACTGGQDCEAVSSRLGRDPGEPGL
ncbi:unnamed protein product [Rangifer tarandus platyrhynchus]|uniref:Uncharacterized protein n=1 Tax=Rangifer tarandus platyrhynchus TaxID=3082113 RepID=A0ABN8Y5J0_RANTA|nr:unnamed protein product [Rangifer tarandus platyrhynchus]